MYYLLFIYVIVFSYIFYKFYMKQTNRGKGTLIISFKKRKYKCDIKLALWIIVASIPFIYISTMRDYSIGTDTNGTYSMIYYYGYAVNKWKVPLYESIYIYFVKLMYAINNEYRFLLFVTSTIICIGFFTYFIKKGKYLNLTVALCGFIALIFGFSLNGQRQVLAMTLSLVFLMFLEKRKPIHSLVVLTLIIFIHVTGVVLSIYYIPYFFKEKKKAQKVIPILFFVAPVLLPTIIYLVSKISYFSRFQRYISAFSIESVNIKYFMFPLLVLPLIFLNWNKLIGLQEDNFMHMCGYIFIFSAILFSGYLWYAFRLMYYFVPSEIILASQIEKCYRNKKRVLINSYIILALVVYFIFVYVMHDTDSIYPFIFEQ